MCVGGFVGNVQTEGTLQFISFQFGHVILVLV